MRSLDFAPLLRSSIGFENLNRLVDLSRGESDSYPPYNIEKTGDGAYRIQMALAGFTRDEIEVTVQDNMLIIIGRAGDASEGEKREYLHRGIATRAFDRRFELADYVVVSRATYENGMLNIELKRELQALTGADGRLSMRFEIAYGHAFKAAPRLRAGEPTTVSLDDMRALVRAGRRAGS